MAKEHYHALLISANQKEGVNKVPTKEQYDQAVGHTTAHCKKVKELYYLIEVAFKDLILLVDQKNKTRKIAFQLIKNCKTNEYPKGNCHLAWMHVIEKYAPRLVSLLLALRKKLENSRLKSASFDPEA